MGGRKTQSRVTRLGLLLLIGSCLLVATSAATCTDDEKIKLMMFYTFFQSPCNISIYPGETSEKIATFEPRGKTAGHDILTVCAGTTAYYSAICGTSMYLYNGSVITTLEHGQEFTSPASSTLAPKCGTQSAKPKWNLDGDTIKLSWESEPTQKWAVLRNEKPVGVATGGSFADEPDMMPIFEAVDYKIVELCDGAHELPPLSVSVVFTCEGGQGVVMYDLNGPGGTFVFTQNNMTIAKLSGDLRQTAITVCLDYDVNVKWVRDGSGSEEIQLATSVYVPSSSSFLLVDNFKETVTTNEMVLPSFRAVKSPEKCTTKQYMEYALVTTLTSTEMIVTAHPTRTEGDCTEEVEATYGIVFDGILVQSVTVYGPPSFRFSLSELSKDKKMYHTYGVSELCQESRSTTIDRVPISHLCEYKNQNIVEVKVSGSSAVDNIRFTDSKDHNLVYFEGQTEEFIAVCRCSEIHVTGTTQDSSDWKFTYTGNVQVTVGTSGTDFKPLCPDKCVSDDLTPDFSWSNGALSLIFDYEQPSIVLAVYRNDVFWGKINRPRYSSVGVEPLFGSREKEIVVVVNEVCNDGTEKEVWRDTTSLVGSCDSGELCTVYASLFTSKADYSQSTDPYKKRMVELKDDDSGNTVMSFGVEPFKRSGAVWRVCSRKKYNVEYELPGVDSITDRLILRAMNQDTDLFDSYGTANGREDMLGLIPLNVDCSGFTEQCALQSMFKFTAVQSETDPSQIQLSWDSSVTSNAKVDVLDNNVFIKTVDTSDETSGTSFHLFSVEDGLMHKITLREHCKGDVASSFVSLVVHILCTAHCTITLLENEDFSDGYFRVKSKEYPNLVYFAGASSRMVVYNLTFKSTKFSICSGGYTVDNFLAPGQTGNKTTFVELADETETVILKKSMADIHKTPASFEFDCAKCGTTGTPELTMKPDTESSEILVFQNVKSESGYLWLQMDSTVKQVDVRGVDNAETVVSPLQMKYCFSYASCKEMEQSIQACVESSHCKNPVGEIILNYSVDTGLAINISGEYDPIFVSLKSATLSFSASTTVFNIQLEGVDPTSFQYPFKAEKTYGPEELNSMMDMGATVSLLFETCDSTFEIKNTTFIYSVPPSSSSVLSSSSSLLSSSSSSSSSSFESSVSEEDSQAMLIALCTVGGLAAAAAAAGLIYWLIKRPRGENKELMLEMDFPEDEMDMVGNEQGSDITVQESGDGDEEGNGDSDDDDKDEKSSSGKDEESQSQSHSEKKEESEKEPESEHESKEEEQEKSESASANSESEKEESEKSESHDSEESESSVTLSAVSDDDD